MLGPSLLLQAIVISLTAFDEPPPSPGHQSSPGLPHVVARNNAGTPGKQPYLVSGESYRYPESAIADSVVAAGDPARTVAFGALVLFRFDGLDPAARYALRATFLSDGPRTEQLEINGVRRRRIELTRGQVIAMTIDLEAADLRSGSLSVAVRKLTGPNAVISTLDLLSDGDHPVCRLELSVQATLEGDLEGRLLDRSGNLDGAGIPLTMALLEPETGTELEDLEPIESVTGPGGRFAAAWPRGWPSRSRATLRIEARGPGWTIRRRRPLDEVLSTRRPRLTPLPARLGAPLEQRGPEREEAAGARPPTAVSLDGTWEFSPAPDDRFFRVPREAIAPAGSSIEVPGQWTQQGFTVAAGAAAGYRRRIAIPRSWRGRSIKLRFDAVFSEADVWLDGRWAGRHEGGFTPFEVDLTGLLEAGHDAVLAVAVRSETLADVLASASQYAAHPLGGITRKVTLFAVPPVHIESLHVETVLDENSRDATLRIDVTTANESATRAPQLELACRVESIAEAGRVVATGSYPLSRPDAGARVRDLFELPVHAPARWDAEHPILHRLVVTLSDEHGLLESLDKRFGFRQVEVHGNRLLVNGTPVKLRGINRHETHPLRGRSLSGDLWRRDAVLFRAANINMVRTSHYPPAEEFIEACDELGIFVEEEAPLCWVKHPANATWNEKDAAGERTFARMVAANLEMIERDRSHPSILYWSLANESRWTESFARVRRMVDAADGSRPKSFHDQAWGDFNHAGSDLDIANIHYPGPDGPRRAAGSTRPVLFGEYAHLNTYNRGELAADPGVRQTWGEGLARMWEAMVATDAVLGGDIWAGIDDLFLLPDGREIGYGEWGSLDGWRRPKPEYTHIKKIYAPVRVLTASLEPSEAGVPVRIELENRHDFSNLAEIGIAWQSRSEAGRASAEIAPHRRGLLVLHPRHGLRAGDTVELTFTSPRGFVIDRVLVPVGQPSWPTPETRPPRPIRVGRDAGRITVDIGSARWIIDERSGQLAGAAFAGARIISGGPDLMILPRQGGPCRPDYRPDVVAYNPLCSGWRLGRIDVTSPTESGAHVSIAGTTDAAEFEMLWEFRPDGEIDISYRLVAHETVDPRQIGLVFRLPRSFETLRWQRDGLWTVYPSNHIGRSSGTARAFYPGVPVALGHPPSPSWPWARDATPLGSRDFRATRTRIHWAELSDGADRGLLVRSNGRHAVRAWVDGDQIRFLVAGHDAGGSEPFFASHLADRRLRLEAGATFEDRITIELRGP